MDPLGFLGKQHLEGSKTLQKSADFHLLFLEGSFCLVFCVLIFLPSNWVKLHVEMFLQDPINTNSRVTTDDFDEMFIWGVRFTNVNTYMHPCVRAYMHIQLHT